MNKPESMKRGQFLRSLGLSTSTLMAFYCLGTTSCTSDEDDPNPAPGGNNNGGNNSAGLTGNATGSNIDFTLDLASDNYKKLKTPGEFVVVGDVLVAFTTASTYVALSKRCTHEGTAVQYRSQQNDVWCISHGSTFNLDGTVKQNPAVLPLKVYKPALSQNGATLRVTE
ncbi:hypothetical protein GCM10027275_03530 [Rhabdobacter roseus]|uniref:Cytochrome b6-f complex iron-sulfur subunit n=1 Tax=Rhabdobacter roseus TaxID=1655419 RepID=A0A840TLY2_9BACT|nr:Rieske (2Fe-2S) protein [Rhabdobacter roseus]MBB5282243.1 cytochrome b6-f complex iron-sulfur subunit [Rhabdobacter roseus]